MQFSISMMTDKDKIKSLNVFVCCTTIAIASIIILMKIIAAPDSFKGNMSAPEACGIIEAGILRVDKGAKVFKIPLADGGEGTARAVTQAAGGRFIKTVVSGPLGGKIEAEFGLIDNGKTAVLDMASASGLELIGRDQLNPMKAASYGTGELIAAALDTGAQELIIGIGGSATNDGGIGLISALGFKVLDEKGQAVGQGGEALVKIAAVDCSGADTRLKNVSIKVACDVTNPLLGSKGASAIFGPQKGATPEMVAQLDSGLSKLADAWIKAGLAKDVEQPGDGAAGGVGAALRICLGAVMESGALLVMKYAGFFNRLSEADLIITGEGMTDGQTAGGKLCSVVAREGRKAGIPVALISGALGGDAPNLLAAFDYAVSIACGQTGLDAMIKDSKRDLGFAAENLIRAIQIGAKNKV
jgi:glycerate kinase